MKKYYILGIPLLFSVLFSFFLYLGPGMGVEHSLYDLLLHIKPKVKEDEHLLQVNIDDLTITNINMYPLSRDIFADGLMLMRELGAAWSLLDIEFIDKSPAGLNNQYLQEQIPARFDTVFYDLSQQQGAFFQALQSGQITMAEAPAYLNQLDDYNYSKQEELLEDVRHIARDNDVYLGRAIKWFGNVICTNNMMGAQDDTTPSELKNLAREKVSLNHYFSQPFAGFTQAQDIKPAIYPVLENSRNAGYPRVNIDPDGVRRRIDLIYDYQGQYYPQLGFSAILQKMDVQGMKREDRKLILQGVRLEEGRQKRQDLEIPLESSGKMMINWPAKKYVDTFRHISFFYLYRHDRLLEDLLYNLNLMNAQGLLEPPFYNGEYPLMELYNYIQSIKEDHMKGKKDADVQEYAQLRNTFFSELDAYVNGPAEQNILDELQTYMEQPDLPEDQMVYFQDLKSFIPDAFAASRELVKEILDIRASLGKELKDSVCIIGYSGTSTTDIGVNPFEEQYMNMGLYASVFNTIVSGQFLNESPLWVPMAVALVMSFLAAFIVSRLDKPVWGLTLGILIFILTEAALVGIFLVSGIYTPLFTPGISIILSFIGVVSINLITSSREKGFIRSAFAQYLSDDVIKDLLDDPSKLSLGGEERFLTAMFTDVKGFSTISEQLSPKNLVALLNDYLTEMSNLVLEEKGTIDKYEGDAIIAFFGAPQPFEDHAIRACRAAVRMKKAEAILNEKMLAEGRSPGPLLTRIGINTGDIVVGNMGTLQKMDYTMMGNAVNLAARLEGVNKQYGTWLLISGAVRKEIGDNFILRRLDRVRVVGIHEPVPLYELVDEKGMAGDNILEGLDIFHKAMDLFEERRWGEANEMFKKCRLILPEDAPSEIYMKRCLKFSKEEPAADWDGVFNLTQK